MKKRTFLMILLAGLVTQTFAQFTPVWQQITDYYTASDVGRGVEVFKNPITEETTVYSVVISGVDTNTNIILISRDANGNQLWQIALSLEDYKFYHISNLYIDEEENVIIIGYARYIPTNADRSFLFKVNNESNLLWQQTYGGSSIEGFDFDDTGEYYYFASQYGNVYKVQSDNGEIVWVKPNYSTTIFDLIFSDGAIYITGEVEVDPIGAELITRKFNESGTIVWTNIYDLPDSLPAYPFGIGFSLAVDNNGRILVGGRSSYHNIVLLAYSPDGIRKTILDRRVGWQDVHDVQVFPTDNGDIYLTGNYINYSAGDFENYVLFTVKIDSNRNVVWADKINHRIFKKAIFINEQNMLWILSERWDGIDNGLDEIIILNGYTGDGAKVKKNCNVFYGNPSSPYSFGYDPEADFATADGISFYLQGDRIYPDPLEKDELIVRYDFNDPEWKLMSAGQNSNTNIYPNPFKDVLYLNTGNEIINCTVFNLQGTAIYTLKNVSGKIEIQTENWPSGVYYIQQYINGTYQTDAVVKIDN
ncbi:MAG: T9SS type A sorting domain-containing protein [Chitinophagales bacterium]|nr:T9SS type A sorting domain-containing protein [Chitinophagales bacterium]